MGVHNTTGENTLFIYLAVLIAMSVFVTYIRNVGNNSTCGNLIRKRGWFGVNISMVLNAMLRGRGQTEMLRLQQCSPPMSTRKTVYAYLDKWYKVHGFADCILIPVIDGRRCPHKTRGDKQKQE